MPRIASAYKRHHEKALRAIVMVFVLEVLKIRSKMYLTKIETEKNTH